MDMYVVYSHTYMHTYIHTYMRIVCLCVCVCVCVCVYVCVCVSSLRWRGKDAIKFVESVTVADVQVLLGLFCSVTRSLLLFY